MGNPFKCSYYKHWLIIENLIEKIIKKQKHKWEIVVDWFKIANKWILKI